MKKALVAKEATQACEREELPLSVGSRTAGPADGRRGSRAGVCMHLGYELCISATSCTQTPSAAGQGQASRTSTEMGECVHAPHGFTVRFMHCRVRDGRGRGHVLRTDGWYTHTLSVGTRTAFYKRGGGICAEPWSDFVDVVSVLVTRRVRVCALWLCACG